MKTFDRKDVFTLVTAEEAKDYIGIKGYFGDSFEELEDDIRKANNAELAEIFPNQETNIVFRPSRSSACYGLFLPASKVKEVEKEKKWRAFRTFEEFVLVVGLIGCNVRFRFKDDISNEFFYFNSWF